MAFTPKDWRDDPDATTPLTAAALENLETRLAAYADTTVTAHTSDTSAAHAASAISVTPAGTIAATDVAAALTEVAGDAATALTSGLAGKADLSSGHVPVAQLGSGTPASGKYVDGASGAWLPLPAQSGSTAARGLVSVGARGTLYKQGSISYDTTGKTSRHQMKIVGVDRAGNFVVRYGHWLWGGTDTLPTGTLRIDASIEHPATGKLYRLTFQGKKTWDLEPGGYIDSDPIGLDGLLDETPYVRTWARAASGTVDLPVDWTSDTNTLAWLQDGDHVMDAASTPTAPGANPGPYQPQTFFYSPVALYARYVDPSDVHCIAFIADSNAASSNRSSFIEQGIDDDYPVLRGAVAGMSLQAWSQPGVSSNPTAASPQFMLAMLEGADIAIIALGTNDLGTITVNQYTAMLADLAAAVKLRGIVSVIACTLPPATSAAGDDWSTTAAQTPSANETVRTGINDAIRAGVAGVDWVADSTSYVEANAAGVITLNGGRWGTAGGASGTAWGNNVHYTTAGHAVAAPPVAAAIAAIVAGSTGGVSQYPFGPPVNSVAPAVTGTAQTGQTLTCSTGTWSPSGTFTYQWKRAGSAISGATSSTYVLQVADEGVAVKCTVTATNGQGNASADSNAVTPTVGPPVNSVAPAITGTATTGQTLTCSTGTWTGSPTGYTYQWKRNGSSISGATSSTYVLQVADEGTSCKCAVTATNGQGSTSADSNTVSPSASLSAPVNTVAPAVTGTATTGSTLTSSTGTWTGNPTPSYAYQWKRAGSAISGATASTYVLQVADEGVAVKCTVTATNSQGSASADSNAVTPTAGFDISALPGLVAYGINTDLGANASLISSWGHGLSLVESTNKPVVATVNSKKVARFDGVDDHLGASYPTAPQTPLEVWIVSKHTGPNAGHKTLFVHPDDGSTLSMLWAAAGAAPAQVDINAGTGLFSANTSLPSDGFHVWRFKFNGASSTIEVDGTGIASGDAGSASNATLNGINLGTSQGGSFQSSYDVAAWVAVTGTLSSGNAASLLSYLTGLMP